MVSTSLTVASSTFTSNGIETFLVVDKTKNNKLITNNALDLPQYGLFNGNIFLGSTFIFTDCNFKGNYAYSGSVISIYDTDVDITISGFNVNFQDCNFQDNMAAEAALIYMSYFSNINGFLTINGGTHLDNMALSKIIN